MIDEYACHEAYVSSESIAIRVVLINDGVLEPFVLQKLAFESHTLVVRVVERTRRIDRVEFGREAELRLNGTTRARAADHSSFYVYQLVQGVQERRVF